MTLKLNNIFAYYKGIGLESPTFFYKHILLIQITRGIQWDKYRVWDNSKLELIINENC